MLQTVIHVNMFLFATKPKMAYQQIIKLADIDILWYLKVVIMTRLDQIDANKQPNDCLNYWRAYADF